LAPHQAYIAPPGRHLIAKPDGTLRLSTEEPVHHVRPSADLLLESVAESYGPRAIGIILTGTGTDGATGASAIKRLGGVVIAQNEETSDYFGMPSAAIHTGSVDYVLPLDEIPGAILDIIAGASTK